MGLQEIVKIWDALGVAGQSLLLGIITSGYIAIVQWLFPKLSVVPNNIKRVIIAIMAGLSAYYSAGDNLAVEAIVAGFSAAATAFGTYHVTKAIVSRN